MRTAADGTFRLRSAVGPGKYRLRVDGEQLLQPVAIEIPPDVLDREVMITVRAKAAIQTIRGIVVDTAGGPVVDASVSTSGRSIRRVSTNRDGSFVMERPQGEKRETVTLVARKQGFEQASTDASLTWGTEDVRLVLPRGVDVTVVITDAANSRPIEHFAVRTVVLQSDWNFMSSHDQGLHGRRRGGKPKTGGRLILEGMRRAVYRLRVEPVSEEYVSSEFRTVRVDDGQPAEVRFALTAPVRRVVHVVDAESRSVAQTRVELLEPLGDKPVTLGTWATDRVDAHIEAETNLARLWTTGSTGANGQLEVTGPGGRLLAVRVLGPGHVPTVVRDVRLDSSRDPLVIAVTTGATVFGTIAPRELLEQMRAISKGAPHMEVKPAGLRLQGSSTDGHSAGLPTNGGTIPIREDGSFTFIGVSPGDWELSIRWSRAYGRVTRQSRGRTIAKIAKLVEGERRKVELDLRHLMFGTVRGRIELDGKPFEGQVSFRGPRSGGVVTADANGRFETTLMPGRYRAVIQPSVDGQAILLHAEPHLDLAPDQTVDQVFRVDKAELQVKILGSNGQPRKGVRLRLKRGEIIRFLDRSNASGVAKIWLSTGPYALSVWPHAMTSPDARRKFDLESQNDPQVAERYFVPVADVEVKAGEPVRVVKLPVASGY